MLPVLVPTSMIVTVVLSSIFLMKKNDVLVSNIFTMSLVPMLKLSWDIAECNI